MKGKIILGLLAMLLIFGASAQTTHNITLTWGASSTAGVNYNVYRGTASGGPYTKLTGTPVAALTYADTAGTAGTKYFYVVTSVCTSSCPAGIAGESGYSNEASAVFLGSPAPAGSLGAVAN